MGTARSAVCMRAYTPPPTAGDRGVLYTGDNESEFVCASNGAWSGSLTCGDLDPQGASCLTPTLQPSHVALPRRCVALIAGPCRRQRAMWWSVARGTGIF